LERKGTEKGPQSPVQARRRSGAACTTKLAKSARPGDRGSPPRQCRAHGHWEASGGESLGPLWITVSHGLATSIGGRKKVGERRARGRRRALAAERHSMDSRWLRLTPEYAPHHWPRRAARQGYGRGVAVHADQLVSRWPIMSPAPKIRRALSFAATRQVHGTLNLCRRLLHSITNLQSYLHVPWLISQLPQRCGH
jgi:hypothetical protein